ncbi:MAG TPA: PQQ-dependent sugar dehydrogenase [Cyclobacteriaceae bacterium]
MKKLTYYLPCILILIISCQEDEPGSSEKPGSLSINIQVGETNLKSGRKSQVSTDNFNVTIFDINDDTVRFWENASDVPEIITLNEGNYYVKVESDEPNLPAFDAAFYEGISEPFDIEVGKNTPIELTALLASVKVSVNFSENVSENFEDFFVRITGEDDEFLTFGMGEVRSGFFIEGELIVFTQLTMDETTLEKTTVIENAQPNDHYIFNIDVEQTQGNGSISIEIGDTLNKDVDIIFNEPDVSEFELIEAFPSLPSFTQPIFLTASGNNSDQLYLIEQSGRILSFINDRETDDFDVYLDIEDRINDNAGERGLLGLAFHPEFENNNLFYVNYTNNSGNTVVASFLASGNQGDPNSETILMEIDQPFANHNAGMLAFGPDGYLYIATGDGGSGGDPENNGQDLTTLLGNILRIDVDNQDAVHNYSIPSENPFINNTEGWREEIFASGFRNPWRFSFDSQNGKLYAGDVGQGEVEEIDVVINGGNYGWNIWEGSECFGSPSDCVEEGFEFPVAEYFHDVGFSVTGGYVYRGAKFPDLQGYYFYGDFVSGRVWILNTNDPESSIEIFNTNFSISSFAVDQSNELYLLDYGSGRIYTLNKI